MPRQQQEKEPAAYVSLWEGEGGNRPALKGTVKFDIDSMKEILNSAVQQQGDGDDYGYYVLELALWDEEDGGDKYPVMKGKLTCRKPQEKKKQRRR